MNDRLYRVKVKGGGSHLLDAWDVTRLIREMWKTGDSRPFTVKPARWWNR